jgi:hypothetical protein
MWLVLLPSWTYTRVGSKTMGYPRIAELPHQSALTEITAIYNRDHR